MIIKIHGEIKNDEQKDFELAFFGVEHGVSFGSIDEAIAAKPEDDDTIVLKIHCNGGLCTEGYAIYDRLRSVPNTTIEAEVEGECSSMATIILLAASKRRATENSRFCIHKPRLPWYFCEEMTEDEAMKAYNDLHDETERMLIVYTERTGQSRETLEALMKEDKYITADEAKDLGFIQDIVKPISATKTKHMSKPNSLKKLLLGVCKAAGVTAEEITEAMKDEKPVGMSLKTDDGTDLEIERDEGEPQVGDQATPDGEHHMPDGSTIIIENGKITEIKPKEEEKPADEPTDDEEKESLKKENQSLKEQVADLTTKLEAANSAKKTTEETEALAFISECGGLKKVKAMRSTYQPPAPEGGKKPQQQAPKSKLEEEYDKLFNQ
jgi:ATP-dependent protease ClpP protease subunit